MIHLVHTLLHDGRDDEMTTEEKFDRGCPRGVVMLILTITALVLWVEMPGPARSVDWNLSQDRHIRQVGWPADNPLKDTYHIGIAGFRHSRKIGVRLQIADGLVYEASQVANVYVRKNDRDAPDLITSVLVVERPLSLVQGKVRFEHLRQTLDMPHADLDAWQRKKMAGGRDDAGSATIAFWTNNLTQHLSSRVYWFSRS